MSGMEPLVALGVASSVVQFVDFGAKLCVRIREYSSVTGAPKKIQVLADHLSLALQTLEGLNDTSRTSLEYERKTLEACLEQAKDLNSLLDSFKPNADKQSKWRIASGIDKARVAFTSLRGEKKMDDFQNSLSRLVGLVGVQLQVRTGSVHASCRNGTRPPANKRTVRAQNESKIIPLCSYVRASCTRQC